MLLLFHVMTFVHGSCEFVLFKEKNKSIWSQFLSLKGPTKKNLANLAIFLKYLIKNKNKYFHSLIFTSSIKTNNGFKLDWRYEIKYNCGEKGHFF